MCQILVWTVSYSGSLEIPEEYLGRRGERVVTGESFSSRFLHPPSASAGDPGDAALLEMEYVSSDLSLCTNCSCDMWQGDELLLLFPWIQMIFYFLVSVLLGLCISIFMMCYDETCLNNQNSISLILFNLNSVASGWQRPGYRQSRSNSQVTAQSQFCDAVYL